MLVMRFLFAVLLLSLPLAAYAEDTPNTEGDDSSGSGDAEASSDEGAEEGTPDDSNETEADKPAEGEGEGEGEADDAPSVEASAQAEEEAPPSDDSAAQTAQADDDDSTARDGGEHKKHHVWAKMMGGATVPEPLRFDLGKSISIQPIARLQARATLFDQDHPEANDPIVYGDPDLREGFSLRRVRLGLQAGWKNDCLGLRIVGGWDNRFDALSEINKSPQLVEAVFYTRALRYLEMAMGQTRVPFGRQPLVSSGALALSERSIASEHMAPQRELAMVFGGSLGPEGGNVVLPENAFQWGTSVSNGGGDWTGDLTPTPRLSARGQLDLFSPWSDGETGHATKGGGLSLGGSLSHNWGLEADTLSAGADLGFRIGRISVVGELFIARATPTFDVQGIPDVLAERNSLGWYAQLVGVIFPGFMEVAMRVGAYDDNRALQDGGDRLDVSGGLNLYHFNGRVKTQLHYIHREELAEGHDTTNDTLLLQWQ
ncbi:MAG TPA: hypothetical protein DIU15_14055, partial [Deltaproteobacteria bacterium]|nr:hypothetical protein [Deltaproteobacteria bacterium]